MRYLLGRPGVLKLPRGQGIDSAGIAIVENTQSISTMLGNQNQQLLVVQGRVIPDAAGMGLAAAVKLPP